MSKLLPVLVYQEVFYQTLLLTSVTEPLGNIVSWDKNILPILCFNLTSSLSTQEIIKASPSHLITCYYNTIICLNSFFASQ